MEKDEEKIDFSHKPVMENLLRVINVSSCEGCLGIGLTSKASL